MQLLLQPLRCPCSIKIYYVTRRSSIQKSLVERVVEEHEGDFPLVMLKFNNIKMKNSYFLMSVSLLRLLAIVALVFSIHGIYLWILVVDDVV
jgi:aromatic ring-opening dioxygenase LigB subunit